MDNEKMLRLLILKLSGEASAGELDELDDLLLRHPDLAVKAASVSLVWKSKGASAPENTDDLFNRHLQRLSDDTAENTPFYHVGPPRRRRSGRLRFLAAATAAAACIVAFLMIYNLSEKRGAVKANVPSASGNFVSTKNGSKSKLQLPDGTQVWLNSGSNISYDYDFGGSTRQVRLTGEAFFD